MVALGVCRHQMLQIEGAGSHVRFVAVVSVHQEEHSPRVEPNLGAFVVARRRTDATRAVAVDGQSGHVARAASAAFLRFALTAHSQGQTIAFNAVKVESADAVTVTNRCQIAQVDQCVDAVQAFPLQRTPYEGFV